MRILFLLCFFITGYTGFAQTPFQELSFEEALKEAQKEGRLIFIQYESANCGQCNEVANKSFENRELADQLSQTFVCLRISPSHQDRAQIGALYNIASGMGSLFIDQNKTLIHSYRMTTSRASDYVSQINRALTMAGESLKISELNQEYKKGNRYIGFMELYLQKRAMLNLATDPLLDEYIGLLPADSLRSIRTIVFIAKMSPILGSNADQALRKDRELFSRAWYSMPNPQRIKINSSIIRKSKNKAIQEKDEAYAYRVASFAGSTYSGNPRAAARSHAFNMLEFYKETNDTSQYLSKAIDYYERYYMSVSVDSVNRTDSLNRARLLAKAPASASFMKGDTMVRTKTIAFSPSGQFLSRDLNDGAWTFYSMTSNPQLLARATQWVKKGLEFYETPAALDTYSRLLYKQGQKQAAIEAQRKAIEQRKKQGYPTKEYETTLKKMMEGSFLIN